MHIIPSFRLLIFFADLKIPRIQTMPSLPFYDSKAVLLQISFYFIRFVFENNYIYIAMAMRYCAFRKFNANTAGNIIFGIPDCVSKNLQFSLFFRNLGFIFNFLPFVSIRIIACYFISVSFR